MSGASILFAARYSSLVLLVTLIALHPCYAKRTSNHPRCIPSSCGNIHNITYPFRLQTDPQNCGQNGYELSCENNLTTLHLNSTKYYVQAINYKNFTIRIVDADVRKNNCSSIPHHSLSRYNFTDASPYYISYENYYSLIFISCATQVNSSLYVDAYPCITNTSLFHLERFFYVVVGFVYVGDLVDSCRIEVMSGVSSLVQTDFENISYVTVHDSMVYGVELTWIQSCCDFSRGNHCKLDWDKLIVYCGHHSFSAWFIYLIFLLRDMIIVLSNIFYFQSTYVFRALPLSLSYLLSFLSFPFSIFVVYHVPVFTCGAPCITFFLISKWRRRHLSMYNNIEEFLQNHNDFMPVRYSYSNIKKITKGFKDKLGEGGYGLVYKGKLRSGRFAAVKMLGKTKANGQEFINEVSSIGRIHHVNVVQLIGFCVEGSKRALVYEFMPNGSLDKHIFSQQGCAAISNEKMFEISVGVARGIEYLHRGCDMQILHFDIKPHNILLDENFAPKVSDFGLAKLYPTDHSIVSLTAARGTMGYMAPELFYKNIGGISYKADVYSFGMLLMEMVGRRKNLDAFIEHSSQIYFPTWVHEQLNNGIDIEFGNATGEEKKNMKKMIIVALWCIQFRPCDRPSMHKVIQMLEGDIGCLELPPRPFLSPQEIPEVGVRTSRNPIRLTGPEHQPSDDTDSADIN